MEKELAGTPGPNEVRKRKRELIAVLVLGPIFLILTWVEFWLTSFSRTLPFLHSIFFFGLVNLNIALLLFLLFLIFRNLVKIFVERQGKIIGSSLKGKLVAAFVTFSFVPTVLMFLISVFYINSSFDKWFSVKMAGVLKDSLEVTNAFYLTAKKKNYHFADVVARDLKNRGARAAPGVLSYAVQKYRLDSAEYYPSVFGRRVMKVAEDSGIPSVPKASLEFLQKGIVQKAEASTVHSFGEGNLVRVIVPVTVGGQEGAVVVSSFIPLSLMSKMDDIASAYQDFKDLNPLEYPIKSIYLILLILMTLVILFGATWFGFHLARQLSTPLELLGLATQRVAQGDYQPVGISSGSQEINRLVANFNEMTKNLDRSQGEVREANQSLRDTLNRLDEHSRYIEIVISNITTGVISVDNLGRVTTINSHAGELLKVEGKDFIGKPLSSLLTQEQRRVFEEISNEISQRHQQVAEKQVQLEVRGKNQQLSLMASALRDEKGKSLGTVFVFDDLTVMMNAQRAAAWREVARRIAHEIKNPLTPIRLSAQRLEKKFGGEVKDPAFTACTQTIIQQVDDLKNLVNEFTNFARLPQVRLSPGNLNEILADALVLYRTGHKDVSFVLSEDKSLPIFKFDPEQIRRVLTNLLDNAVAAAKGISESKVEITTSYDSVLGLAKFSVVDNGAGIPEEVRGRVFEPYVSTKEHGTGLGLAIVKRIVEDHNGFIRVLGNEPQGTKFVVELPVVG